MKKQRVRLYPPGLSAKLLGMAEWLATKVERIADLADGYGSRILKMDEGTIIVVTNQSNTVVKVTGGGSTFIVVPKISLPDTTILTGLRSFLSLGLTAYDDCPFSSLMSPYPLHEGRTTKAPLSVSGTSGYVTGRTVFRGVGSMNVFSILSAGGVLRVDSQGGIFPLNSLSLISGSSQLDYAISGPFSKDGARMVTYSFNVDTSMYVIDLFTVSVVDGVPQVVVDHTDIPTFGVAIFGSTINTTRHFSAPVDSGTKDATSTVEQDIAFPVCYALTAAGALSGIFVREVQSYSQDSSHVEAVDAGTLIITFSDSVSNAFVQTIEITLPNGVTKIHTLRNDQQSYGGSGIIDQAHPGIGGITGGSGTISEHQTSSGTMTILYADADYPVLVYGLEEVVTVIAPSSTVVSVGFSGVLISSTYTTTTRRRVIALVGAEERVLYDVTTVSAPLATSFVVAGYIGGLTNSSSSSSVPSPVTDNQYFYPNRLAVTDRQLASKPSAQYLGSFVNPFDASRVNIGHTDLAGLKLKTINRVLASHDLPALAADVDISGYDYWFSEVRVA